MRVTGVEPARLATQEPKSCVYANFTIPAYVGKKRHNISRYAGNDVYNLLKGRVVIASQVHAPFVRINAGGLQSADKASLRLITCWVITIIIIEQSRILLFYSVYPELFF